jgi:hypothetical protein
VSGRLVLTREHSGRRDRRRRYKVLLDDEQVGTIGDREVQAYLVAPGEHVVRLKLDWTTSNKVTVQLGETEDINLVCRPGGGDLRTAFDAVFKHRSYMKLEQPS